MELAEGEGLLALAAGCARCHPLTEMILNRRLRLTQPLLFPLPSPPPPTTLPYLLFRTVKPRRRPIIPTIKYLLIIH